MPIDFTNGTWMQVAEWARAELERARKRNDGDLTPEQTATLRGEIKALKRLLGLPEEAARASSAESVNSPFGGTGPTGPATPDWRN